MKKFGLCTGINHSCLLIFVGSDDSDEERKRTSRVSQTQGKPPAKATSKAKSLPAKIREQDQMVSNQFACSQFSSQLEILT